MKYLAVLVQSLRYPMQQPLQVPHHPQLCCFTLEAGLLGPGEAAVALPRKQAVL